MSSGKTKQAPIKEIRIDNNGHMHVLPAIEICGSFDFIWRDASGIRWDTNVASLIAAEPDRWEYFKLFGQILAAVQSEYGWQLSIAPNTLWFNVPNELRQRIESFTTPST